MPTARVADALRTLARDPDPAGDGELVIRFADRRDEAAFAELIRRHGPTVFGVCRRILGHTHDAEDAFQAVWLVLARRATDVQPPGSVGNFLYGVAVRTATKARNLAAKRRQRLMSAAKPEPVVDAPADTDLRGVLDEELGRLPDKYRAAVVLCDLTGKSRSAAAAELGWPEGTVAARLAKGRDLLADRLRRRGVSLSAGALAAALAPEATAAAVPAALAHEALAASLGWATASPSATLLAEGAMRTFSAARWKLPAVALTLCGLAATVVIAAQSAQPRQQPAAQPAAPAVEAPVPPAGPWKETAVLELAGWLPGSVTYSPDGMTLLIGGTNGQVVAYHAGTHKPLWTHAIKAVATQTAVAYSRDGKTIAATFRHGVVLIDAATGKETDTINEPDSNPSAVGYYAERPVEGIVEKMNGLVFGNARGTFLKTWIKWPNVGTIHVSAVQAAKEPADPFAVPLAVDPRANAVAHAVSTGPIHRDTGKHVLWAYGSGGNNPIMEGHKAAVTAAAWSTDGKTIATADAEGLVILWDAATFKEKSRLAFDRRVVAAALSPDGSRAAVAVVANDQIQGAGEPSYHELVYVWDAGKPPAKPGEPIGKAGPFGGPFQGTAGLAFAPDGKALAAGFANLVHLNRLGRLIGKVRVWTLAEAAKQADPKPAQANLEFRQQLRDHGDGLNAIALAPGGKTFATGGRDGEVVVWDAATRKQTLRFQPNKAPVNSISHRVNALAYSTDGRFIAVSHRDGVSLHLATTGEVTNFPGRKGPIDSGQVFINPYAIAFSPDGKLFASAGAEQGLRVIDTTTGFDVSWPLDRSVPGPKLTDPPRPDDDGAAPRSAGIDPPIVTALAFSPDGSKLARTENTRSRRAGDVTCRVRVHESRTGKVLATIESAGWVLSLAWSHDGKRLAASGTGGHAALWDGETFKELRKFELGQTTEVTKVAFTPDDSTLATALFRYVLNRPNTTFYEYESEVRLWDPATGAERQRLPGHPDERFSDLSFTENGQTLYATAGKLYEPKGGTGPGGRKEPGGVLVWEREPHK